MVSRPARSAGRWASNTARKTVTSSRIRSFRRATRPACRRVRRPADSRLTRSTASWSYPSSAVITDSDWMSAQRSASPITTCSAAKPSASWVSTSHRRTTSCSAPVTRKDSARPTSASCSIRARGSTPASSIRARTRSRTSRTTVRTSAYRPDSCSQTRRSA